MPSSSGTSEVALQIKAERQASDRLPYMVQLDALRAFAVFGVLFGHFYLLGQREILPIAHWSVQLFFVLSGFLITGILLQCREVDRRRATRIDQLRQFYIRRTLRIFPVFYLVVVITAVLNIYPVRETFLWLVTYTTNIHLALRGSWHGSIDHLWTLAVEEQFYLVWPWLILFVRDKYLLPAIVSVILFAPLFKVAAFVLGLNDVATAVLAFANVDSLGVGALLAVYRYKKPSHFERLGRHWAYVCAGPILAIGLVAFVFRSWPPAFAGAAGGLLLAVVLAWVVHRAAVGFGGAIGYVFETKPLLHCGKISYGIYLYHHFLPAVVRRFCQHFHLQYPQAPALRFVLLASLAVAIASLSWVLFERPINNLKRRFRYSKL
jgi:peptidoglycan/LPS O-acetylase OafA/YrhL